MGAGQAAEQSTTTSTPGTPPCGLPYLLWCRCHQLDVTHDHNNCLTIEEFHSSGIALTNLLMPLLHQSMVTTMDINRAWMSMATHRVHTTYSEQMDNGARLFMRIRVLATRLYTISALLVPHHHKYQR